jgi:hypothetical protein
MAISKDESIITQVAAKIAADLTPDSPDVNARITDWVIAFDAVREAMFDAHSVTISSGLNDPAAAVNSVFPNTQPAPQPQYAPAQQPQFAPTNMAVQVKGTQHGPLPDWLVAQCSAAGVTQVWDNRDGLAQNPKRPWFKAADGTKNNRGEDMAFWPPRGR